MYTTLTNTTILSGKTFLPLSGNEARGLVVLLHGYAGNATGLFRALAPLREQFTDLAFAVPNGPFRLADNSFAWIKLTFPINAEQVWNGAVLAAPILNNYTDQELRALNLTGDQLILMGFSQGAIISMHIGLRRKTAPLSVIALAGFLAGEQHLDEITSRPPVYLISGGADMVVTPEMIASTAKALAGHGVEVHTSLVEGLGHTISQKVLEQAGEALSAVWPPLFG